VFLAPRVCLSPSRGIPVGRVGSVEGVMVGGDGDSDDGTNPTMRASSSSRSEVEVVGSSRTMQNGQTMACAWAAGSSRSANGA
jgi:hypothetical protein